MFVRCGVEDYGRLLLLEDRFQTQRVSDVRNAGDDIEVGVRSAKLTIDLEEDVLRPLEQYEAVGKKAGYLTAHFRADAAAGTGHQHMPAAKLLCDLVGIQFDRLPTQ